MEMIISPYDPEHEIVGKSTLRIDPIIYKEKLLEVWSKTRFYDHDDLPKIAFRWSLPGTEFPNYAGSSGSLLHNLQTIGFGYGVNLVEFILWHRSIIPAEHRLFLYFQEPYYGVLELTVDTTAEEIKKFVGLSD